MGVIEAIKRGFGIATKMLSLVVVLFIFNAIWNIGSIPLTAAGPQNPGATAGAAIFSLIFILASVFIQGGTLGLVRDFIKGGTQKLEHFVGYGLKYFLRLLGLGVIVALLVAVIALVATLIIAVTAPANNVVLTIIASIIAIAIGAGGLYFVILLIMAPYALVCDEMTIIEALKTSMEKVRKNIGRVLGLLALLILISLGIGFVIGFITGLATIALPATVGQVIIGIVNSAFNAYLGIVMLGSFMLFYQALSGSTSAPASKPTA